MRPCAWGRCSSRVVLADAVSLSRIWPLVGAETMRALDRHTIEVLGVPGEVLMESAGRSVAELALSMHAELPQAHGIHVVCGAGNNGGDGLVVARHAAQAGVRVAVELVADPEHLSDDAERNLARARAVGVRVTTEPQELQVPHVVVDALFGTGLSREVTGKAAAAIERIRRAREHGSRVLSVDVPSGLDADRGAILGCAVKADRTLAISLPKVGLALEPGRKLAGEVSVIRIGIADEAPGVFPDAELWKAMAVAKALPERPAAGHKGTFGHVLVVAGSAGKTGAAALAAEGAARSGAGLVTLACPAGLNDILEVKCTEAMTVAVPETAGRDLSAAAVDDLLELAATRDAVVIGPGIGRSPDAAACMRAFARRVERPVVIDADGLTALKGEPEMLASRSHPTVLTPHPGEAAELLGSDAASVNADRIGAAQRLAERSGAIVVLKGAGTVCVKPGARPVLNATGGPALATGGTGDVLAGVVGSLLAQGLDPLSAAVCGVFVHGATSDRLAVTRSGVGVLAGELAAAIPETLRELEGQREGAEDSADRGEALALPFPGT